MLLRMRWWQGLAVLALSALGVRSHATALPAYSVQSGTTITPAAADTWYCAQTSGCNTSGTRALWATNYPVEIKALANALHNNVDLIYEYVRNNIEIVPMFGLQKGALGALIDRSGTAFDQAQLMVELLRSSGYTASYIQGTITLNATQIQGWLGVTDAASLTSILADGGIPATVTPTSGTVTSVTLSHIWVQVQIPTGGATYLFDPSFKPHTFTAGLNIATASGWSDTSFLSVAQSGMTSGTQSANSDTSPGTQVAIPYVANVNDSGIQTQLASYATSLVSYMKAHGSVTGQVYATEQLEDVLGRQDIVWETYPNNGGIPPLRQTTLPYTSFAVLHTWPGNIPDVYRVKVTVEMLAIDQATVRLSQQFFADEVYGRRMYYQSYLGTGTWFDDTTQLQIDGNFVGAQYSGSDGAGARSGYVRLSIDHPYAANSGTYLDATGATAILKAADFVSPVAVVIGLGDTSDRLQAKLIGEQIYDRILPASTYYTCNGTNCEEVDHPAQPAQETSVTRAYTGWLEQYTRMAMIQTRLRPAVHQLHHSLGVSYRRSFLEVVGGNACSNCWAVGEGALVLDVDTAVSVNSKTGLTNDRRTLARSLAAAADTLEGSQYEQISQTATPASVAHRFDWNATNTATMRYFLEKPGVSSADIFPTGPTPYYYPSIYGAVQPYTAAGYKVIVAENEFMGPGRDCAAPPCTSSQTIFRFERGGALEAFGADGVTTAHIVTDQTSGAFKGGSAGDPPNYDETFKPDKSADLLKDQFKDRSRDFGVDLSNGDFTYSPGADVSVGLGEFPYKLSFERTFKSGESHSPGMGKGWYHNLDIRVNLTTNGEEALGKSSTLNAASTLIAIYATQQIYATEPTTDATYLARWVITPFVQAWWASQIRFNTVSYTAGNTTKTFVRLPDNTFNTPGGYIPTDGSSYWKVTQTGVPTGYGVHWALGNISFTLTSPAKDVQSFTYWGRPNRDQSQTYLFGPHHGWHITSWTFPQGMSLGFNYVPVDLNTYEDDYLVSVSNSLGRQINFTAAANSSWDQCNVQSVDDNVGHSATFNCATAAVTSPAGDIASVSYGVSTCNIAGSSSTNRAMCSPFLSKIYGPSDTTSAKSQLTYDAVGRVNTYADAVAVKTPTSRNPYSYFITGGTRGERQDPAGYLYTVYYDAWVRAISFTDELVRTSSAQYDGLNRVIQRVTPEKITTQFAYDPRGNVTQLQQTPKTTIYSVPATLTVNATYDSSCGKIKTVQDANTNTTTWTYNPTTCLLSQVQQPAVSNKGGANANPTTVYNLYTSVGLLDTMTDPTGVAVKYTYDTSGNRTEGQVDPTGLNIYKNYGYDSVGNITSVTNARTDQTQYQYDADRRVTLITEPIGTCNATTSALTQNIWTGGLVTKVRRAAVCNPNFSTDANWQVWLKTYTPTDKILLETDPNSGTVQTAYDPDDRVQSTTQSIGGGQAARVTYTQYDAAGEVYQTYKAYGTPDQITYAQYTYSLDGRQLSYLDADQNLTTLDYDGYGRLAEMLMPGSAANVSAPCHLTYTAGDNCELYGYDNNGNMTSKRNRSGKTITMLFDALNRETSRTVPANAAGNYARTLTTTYDLASRKWALTADGQTLQQGYDTAGRLGSVNDSLLNALGANIGNVSYTYDVANNRTLVNFTAAAGSWGATYNYDAGERLSSVTNGSTTLAQYAYDPLSRVSTISYFDSTSVGFAYEADDDLQTITHNFNGGSLVLGYTHNGAHQILTNSISDASYLMKQIGPTTGYTENTLNQYTVVGASTMSYDLNGNLTGDGVWTYSYDEENRLRQAVGNGTTAVYAYDPSGRRRSKTVNGTVTYFISDGANELAELGSTGARLRLYLNANGMDNRLGIYDDGLGFWRIYHTNHQGSVLFTTENATSGTIYDQYHYGAYGEPPTTDAATGNPIRYTGRYLDAETGLYYYRARYYSTKLGRFLQTDPIGTKDDMNLYNYASSDPVNKVDPSGLTCNQVSGGTGSHISSSFDCQVDSIKNADGTTTQRKDFTPEQKKLVAGVDKQYTAAVNKLVSHPSKEALVAISGKPSFKVTAGMVASRLIESQVMAMPGVAGGGETSDREIFLKDGILGGSARYQQMAMTHEGIHWTGWGPLPDGRRSAYGERSAYSPWFPGDTSNQDVHQDAYNKAATELLEP